MSASWGHPGRQVRELGVPARAVCVFIEGCWVFKTLTLGGMSGKVQHPIAAGRDESEEGRKEGRKDALEIHCSSSQ